MSLVMSFLGSICETCGCNDDDCPGHFGHVVLYLPAVHPRFLPTVVKLLQCLCMACNELLVPLDQQMGSVQQRLQAQVGKSNVTKKCSGCEAERTPVRLTGSVIKAGRDELSPERAMRILANAPAMPVVFPEHLFISVLPVPPPHVRPAATESGREDKMTQQLKAIVIANERCKELARLTGSAAPGKEADTLASQLANSVKRMRANVAAFCELEERINGKKGRFRANLMGKRVDQSARTVITGDPNLQLDEVGVPVDIARTLTLTVTVTSSNKAELTALVRRGGAKWVKLVYQGQCRTRRPSECRQLREGMMVVRYLCDGDIVVLNRQPSLHKASMMAHRVRVNHPSVKTFNLNLSATTPYNADFDGDEMNLHVPQSLEAQAEANELMNVAQQILQPQASKPVIGIVQDALLGLYLLSSVHVFLTRSEVMQLVMWIPDMSLDRMPVPAILKPTPLWTGKQIASLVLPENLSFGAAAKIEETLDDTLEPCVRGGELLQGRLTKKTLGPSRGGIVHQVALREGLCAAARMISVAQHVTNSYLTTAGFSVGIGDCELDKATRRQTRDRLVGVAERVAAVVETPDLETHGGMTRPETAEFLVKRMANHVTSDVGVVVLASNSVNNFRTMADCGSKGGPLNMAQIMGCVGQQNINGDRINGYKSVVVREGGPRGDRPLSSLLPGDIGLSARGFVFNNFFDGLTPLEFYMHAIGGREGLVDTACKTATTGYMERRLIKTLESVQQQYDHTVRDSRGRIVQMRYGGDGFDPKWAERQSPPLLEPRSDFEKRFRFAPDAFPNADPFSLGWLDMEMQQLEGARALFASFKNADVFLPLNFPRLIAEARSRFAADRSSPPWELVRAVDQLITWFYSQQEANCLTTRMVAAAHLASKPLRAAGVGLAALSWLIDQVKAQVRRALVQPGESVGIVAAQSVSEPATQMTLNTFHSAGAANGTHGVPRIEELINVKEPLAPMMKIYTLPGCLENLMGEFDSFSLDKVVAGISLDTVAGASDQNAALIATWTEFEDLPEHCSTFARIDLDRARLTEHGVAVADVANILQEWGGVSAQIYSDETARADGPTGLAVLAFILGEEGQGLEARAREICAHVFQPGVDVANVYKQCVNVQHWDDVRGMVCKKEEILVTSGSALEDVLTMDGVDATRTRSNVLSEVANVLGIEAAHNVLVSELREVMDASGSFVNDHHLTLIADMMTRRGNLTPMTHPGLTKHNESIMQRSTFERAVSVLVEAAVSGDKDQLTTPSGALMIGNRPKTGTGLFSVFSLQK